MPEPGHMPVELEDQYHHYTGNRIPWYVRLMWVGFWVLTVVYCLRYLFPAMQRELFSGP